LSVNPPEGGDEFFGILKQQERMWYISTPSAFFDLSRIVEIINFEGNVAKPYNDCIPSAGFFWAQGYRSYLK
jgi:hypothetical protein